MHAHPLAIHQDCGDSATGDAHDCRWRALFTPCPQQTCYEHNQHQGWHEPEQSLFMSRQIEAAQGVARASAAHLLPGQKEAHQHDCRSTKIYLTQHIPLGRARSRGVKLTAKKFSSYAALEISSTTSAVLLGCSTRVAISACEMIPTNFSLSSTIGMRRI